MNKEEIIDFEQLWDSAFKCRKSVTWKPSTMSFTLNAFEQCLSMENKLKNGTWKNGKPRPIEIMYPKKREGLSIPYRDRVYQRSINDNELYPEMTRHFIYDNCACQHGKGPDFARERVKKDLHNFVMKYGLDGWVWQYDIHGYYPSMEHEAVNNTFKQYLDYNVYRMVADVLDQQYTGDTGYNPGSQMVQIAGISFLNRIDHICKEQLHMKDYRRYMDDGLNFEHDYDKAMSDMDRVIKELSLIGLSVNEKKTHVTPIKDGFKFLGFYFRPTATGKVIMTIDSDNVKHERRKLRRMVNKAKRGEMTKEKVDECYADWKAYVIKGNSYKLLQRMDRFYADLWR